MSEKTDELRRLLDERGIKWGYGMHGPSFSTEIGTAGNEVTFIEVEGGLLCSTYLRPEQIADIFASFGPSKEGCGRETCHINVRNGDWYCDGCGEMVGTCDNTSELFIDGNAINLWKYCPFCGRKVVG